uniref:Reverse transcriptase domain-containing protein n=1 Tax=Fagus sylvatica TaxID=28930 RepID=A0A2N9GRU6_FAGSY
MPLRTPNQHFRANQPRLQGKNHRWPEGSKDSQGHFLQLLLMQHHHGMPIILVSLKVFNGIKMTMMRASLIQEGAELIKEGLGSGKELTTGIHIGRSRKHHLGSKEERENQVPEIEKGAARAETKVGEFKQPNARPPMAVQRPCELAAIQEPSESPMQPLLERFPQVFEEPKGLPPNRGHEYQIVLKERVPPHCQRPYRYPYFQKTEIEKIMKELIDSSCIRPSQSPFASPVLLVRKVNGSWRMCVDYRGLNKKIVKDKFPIPVIDELLDELQGAMVFSKLDLSKGLEEHEKHLTIVLQTLANHKLYAKMSKCVFAANEVEYLRHVISRQKVQTDPKKIKAMKDWPIPKNLKTLRGFLGLTGYYRKFIKGYGQIAAPLTALLKKNAFEWTNKANKAFERLKEAVSQPPVLALPDFK